ncbi:MAG: hypothetical protein AABX32_06055 [Nanoarchaeota archaeon]
MIKRVLGKISTPLYPSNLVDIIINFVIDSNRLFGEEHSPNLDKYGYAGYLRVISHSGVNNPLVLRFVRETFGVFGGVPDICDRIESVSRRYDNEWWESLSKTFDLKNILSAYRTKDDHNYEGTYLNRFIPKAELTGIFERMERKDRISSVTDKL